MLASPDASWLNFGLSQCGAPIDLNQFVTGDTGGTWSGTGVDANGVFTPNDLAAGAYSVTATDENGCSVSVEVIITETDEMTISEVHSDYNGFGVSCNGATDGFIDITVQGGTGS